MLDEAIARVSQLQDQSLAKTVLSQDLLQPTAILNPGALVPLAEMCARALRDDPAEGDRLLLRIDRALFGNDALNEKARELIDGRGGQPFRSLQPLFAPEAPLEDCDRILAEPEPWPASRDLLERHRGTSDAAETALAIVTIMASQEAAAPADMAWFAITAVLHAFERPEIGAASLSIEAALDALSLDIPDNRHALQLTERLAAFPAADVARGVEERMAEAWDEWGAVHLVSLAGELQLFGTIPMLIDCLDLEEAGDSFARPPKRPLSASASRPRGPCPRDGTASTDRRGPTAAACSRRRPARPHLTSPSSDSRTCSGTTTKAGAAWRRPCPTAS